LKGRKGFRFASFRGRRLVHLIFDQFSKCLFFLPNCREKRAIFGMSGAFSWRAEEGKNEKRVRAGLYS